MEIIIQDTLNLYKQMINLPEGQRDEFFINKLMKPFDPMFETMHMPKTPEAIASIPLLGRDSDIKEMLEKLEKANVWTNARRTMEATVERFEKTGMPFISKLVVAVN